MYFLLLIFVYSILRGTGKKLFCEFEVAIMIISLVKTISLLQNK
jgi:hypothetical protein